MRTDGSPKERFMLLLLFMKSAWLLHQSGDETPPAAHDCSEYKIDVVTHMMETAVSVGVWVVVHHGR